MIALMLIAIAMLSQEVSTSMGKRAVAKKSETIYSYGFLNLFWAQIFFLIAVIVFHRSFYFNVHSLPFFLPRLVLEMLLAYLVVRAVNTADRSTFAFLRLITIPLLVVIDIILGYKITPVELAGILLVFVTLVYLVGHHAVKKKGSTLLVITALIAPITLSLYKYDITHYNSVAAEQTLITLANLSFFTLAAWYHGQEKTWKYLFKKKPEGQSLLQGLGDVLNGYAYAYVPASIALTFGRTIAIIWAIIFGNLYFHEKKLHQKLSGFAVLVLALILIAAGAR